MKLWDNMDKLCEGISSWLDDNDIEHECADYAEEDDSLGISFNLDGIDLESQVKNLIKGLNELILVNNYKRFPAPVIDDNMEESKIKLLFEDYNKLITENKYKGFKVKFVRTYWRIFSLEFSGVYLSPVFDFCNRPCGAGMVVIFDNY